MNEMAAYLTGRGHEVTIITSHDGPKAIDKANGYVAEYHRSVWKSWMARCGVLDFHVFPLTTLRRLLFSKFDIVHTFNFTDTLAACLCRRLTGTPVLLHLNTIPAPVAYRRSLTTGGALLRRAIELADETLTISRLQQTYFQDRFGRAGQRIEAPVDLHKFRLSTDRDGVHPILLCASALEDRRKGGRLLMRAFNRVKQANSQVRLELCHPASKELRQELLELVEERWQTDIKFLAEGDDTDLSGIYGRASALVLPSLWEAFPMVVIEALATGTPVAGTRDGGIAELLSDPRLGRTFEPGPPDAAEPSNVDGLVQAILEVLDLSRRPDTAQHCREFSKQFSWDVLGPKYEILYESMMASRRSFKS
jgi:glycosyltransferase involved in cell wall biosynthesis